MASLNQKLDLGFAEFLLHSLLEGKRSACPSFLEPCLVWMQLRAAFLDTKYQLGPWEKLMHPNAPVPLSDGARRALCG